MGESGDKKKCIISYSVSHIDVNKHDQFAPSKIHKNAPISLKIGTKVLNHLNQFSAPRADFWQISSEISKISKFWSNYRGEVFDPGNESFYLVLSYEREIKVIS